ncbi:hypothetical protein MMC22_008310 [Lobaria immixta]|nr:hypothetical protein [Lobaria immixta]
MSSTADRWFVPDREYHRSISDYALVHQSAASVREQILDTDDAPSRIVDAEDTFMTEYYRLGFEPCYDFAVARLVYADVDDENPSHKEYVNEWTKETSIESDSEETAKFIKELVKALVDQWFPREDFPPEENEENTPEDDRERWTLRDLKWLARRGLLESHIVSRILTAKTVEEKEQILNLMSSQIKFPTKRPVLALIDMIDSKQTTEIGETEGWVIGYDFIKELLVIKPFGSKGGNHPLGARWYGEVAQDGVSFSGTLQEFTTAYIELGKTVEAGNQDDGFKMLVHTLAAEWMHPFETELETVYGAEFHADLLAVKEAMEKIKQAMEEIKFPAVEKNKKVNESETQPFSWLLNMIESEEATIRDAAVDAKERGQEKIAQNAAKLYESIHKQIKAFIENPDLDL